MPPKTRTTVALATWAVLAAAVVVLAFPYAGSGTVAHDQPAASAPEPAPGTAAATALSLSDIEASPRVALPATSNVGPVAGSTLVATSGNASVSILLGLAPENASALAGLMGELENATSPSYQHYLTAAAFDAQFAPDPARYTEVVGYLASFNVSGLTTYPDRLAVSFSAAPATVGEILGTPVERFSADGEGYWAATGTPSLPAPVESAVASVAGLGSSSLPIAETLAGVGVAPATAGAAPAVTSGGGPSSALAPVTLDGVQYIYPADLQTAYDEESLLSIYGYPTSADLAAIVWSGVYDGSSSVSACGETLAPDTAVGPYVPSDLTQFFAATTPSGEPTATVTDVPVDGSAAPGCLASWDTTGVVASNTAQLEAMGALAPGASIYAMTAPAPSLVELEDALEEVLSPPTTLPTAVQEGLANVTVVETGWAAMDVQTSGTSWVTELEEAETRGVTVVAATGDSGDNTDSSAWPGTDATFPATSGGSTYGPLAVGGLTVTLNATTFHLRSEAVWNVSASDATENGPAGSAGGLSSLYVEPTFQANSSANGVLATHRGIPDVSALANNSLLTLTVDGEQYGATNASNGGPFLYAWGTAVASAVTAGLLAVIDHSLASVGDPALGFVDPAVYYFGDRMDSPPNSGGQVVSTPTGTYDSDLPTTPFYDVTTGRNDVYRAAAGYDLASGWGSLDAYNFTMYVIHPVGGATYGELSGVKDVLRLTGLQVSSTGSSYNASVQQDFFLANALGAPVYEVESVIYVSGGSTTDEHWSVNFTANLSYPFSGFYPGLAVHEVWFPSVGQVEGLPFTPTLSTNLIPASGTNPPTLEFTFGSTYPTLTLPAPGAAYIIGTTGYTYSWQGSSYTDGPTTGGSAKGYLAPQFGLLGGPAKGAGTYGPATAGTVTAWDEAIGASVFTPAQVGSLTRTNAQSTATATGLSYTVGSGGTITIAYLSGSTTEGIYQAESPYYPLYFNQTGAPDGATWYVNASNGAALSGSGATASVSTAVPNGTYTWTAAINVAGWASQPPSGELTVSGASQTVDLTFSPSHDTVTFHAKWPNAKAAESVWYVNVSGGTDWSGNNSSYTVSLAYGSYTYQIGSGNHSYVADQASGSLKVGPTPTTIDVTFVPRTYTIYFLVKFPSPALPFTVSLGGASTSARSNASEVVCEFKEPEGNYSWSVTGLPLGYAALPGSGLVDVHGPVVIDVRVSTTGWGPFGLGLFGYVIIGVAVALVVVWTTVLLYRRRHRLLREEEGVAGAPGAVREPDRDDIDDPWAKRPPKGPTDLRPDEL